MRPRVTIQRVLAPLAVALLLVGVAKSQTAGASARVVPKLVLQLGHGGPVHSITFSPNGELLASASDDQTVRLWDPRTGELRRILTGHDGVTWALAFSPDGRTVAFGAGYDSVELLDPRTGGRIGLLGQKTPYRVGALAFSPDGKTMAIGLGDKTIKLWNVQTRSIQQSLSGNTEAAYALSFSPDGQRLVSGHWNGEVKLWNLRAGIHVRRLPLSGVSVRAVSFSPDGRAVVAGSRDGTVRLWDARTGRLLRTLPPSVPKFVHSAGIVEIISQPSWMYVGSVAFAPEGKTIVTGSGDAATRLWDARTGKLKWITKGDRATVGSVAISPNGRMVASVEADENQMMDADIRLLDAKTGNSVRILRERSDWGSSGVFSPDGGLLAREGADDTLDVWDTHTGRLRCTWNGSWGFLRDAAFSPDGLALADAAAHDGRVQVWTLGASPLRDRKPLAGRITATFTSPPIGAYAVAFSPDGKLIAAGCGREQPRSGEVQLWDWRAGKLEATLKGHTDAVYSVAFSPDGKLLGSGGNDQTVRLWDVASRSLLRALPVRVSGLRPFTRFVAFSPNGKTVVTNSGFGDLQLWNVRTGKLERSLETTGGNVDGAVFSQNGTTLVTAHGPWQEPACVRVWDLPTGRVKRTLAVSTGPHPALSLSDDGKRLSVKQGDGTVQLWDVHTRRLLATLVHLPASKPGAPLTDWVVFTPDGYYDGSRGAEQFIRWRLDNRLFPARKFERRFRRPDVVRDVLQQSKK